MVENLNRLTFSRFGKILRDSLPNRGFPEGDAWTETVRRFTAADARFFKLTDGELYLACAAAGGRGDLLLSG